MTPQEKQNLKARFLGMHIGCEANVFKNGNAVCYGMNLGVAIHGGKVVIDAAPDRKYNDADFEFKLILRPLSDITDEEAVELARSLYKNDSRAGWLKNKVASDNSYSFLDGFYFDSATLAIDYLRSRNFCLPFHGLDPVAEGWAILETTNQPQG